MNQETIDQKLRARGAELGRDKLHALVSALEKALPPQSSKAQVPGVTLEGRSEVATVDVVLNKLAEALTPIFRQHYAQAEVDHFLMDFDNLRDQVAGMGRAD
jgi:hypothetical protein